MLPNELAELDPRVKRTRGMIYQAFKELISEKGFHALSVKDVTERAEVNRATFYAHFPDKYALLDHAVRLDFHQEIDKRMLNACHFTNDNLRDLIITVCEFIHDSHDRCGSVDHQFRMMVGTQVRAQVYELLYHWIEANALIENCTVSRERAATAASWTIYGLASDWSARKGLPAVEQYADEVHPLVAANLGLTIAMA